MANDISKSWKALFERRTLVVNAIRRGIDMGINDAKRVLAEAGRQEALLGYEKNLSTRDQRIAKKELFGDIREEKLLGVYNSVFRRNKNGGLSVTKRKLSDDAGRKVNQAKRLDGAVLAEERNFARLLNEEAQYVEQVKKRASELLKDWEDARSIASRLPVAVKTRDFAIIDGNVYSSLAAHFGPMHAKVEALKKDVFTSENIVNAANKLDAALKNMLVSLRGVDLQERRDETALANRRAA